MRFKLVLIIGAILVAIIVWSRSNTAYSHEGMSKVHEPLFKSSQITVPKENMCGKTIQLDPFPPSNPDKNSQMFFIDAAFKPRFKGRVMCAFESVLTLGKLPVKVMVRSKNFTIDHPAMCSLFEKFYPDRLNIYFIDPNELFKGTPLEGIAVDNGQSRGALTNLSDLMRAALLYVFGGFYFDQDVVALKDLRSYRNVVVMDNILTYPNETCGATSVEKSTMLNQGTMHFEKGNKYLHFFLTVLNHSWTHGVHPVGLGPGAMHTAASRFLGYEGQPSSPISTPLFTIVPSFTFRLLAHWAKIKPPRMFNVDVDGSYFDKFIRCSNSLHLTAPESKKIKISGNPRKDVYSYLGPTVCPLSFAHLQQF